MNNIVQTTDNKWLIPIVVAYVIIMFVWMMFCGIASRNIKAQETIINNTTTTTMQWSADTCWTNW